MTITEHPAIERLRVELKEIEAKVTTYSLADAIREGSTVTEQMIGDYYDNERACALSAAFIATRARNGS